jgi:hypothetical protein
MLAHAEANIFSEKICASEQKLGIGSPSGPKSRGFTALTFKTKV